MCWRVQSSYKRHVAVAKAFKHVQIKQEMAQAGGDSQTTIWQTDAMKIM